MLMLNPERKMQGPCITLKKLFQHPVKPDYASAVKAPGSAFGLKRSAFRVRHQRFALIGERSLFSAGSFQINRVIGLDHIIILEHKRGGKQEVGR